MDIRFEDLKLLFRKLWSRKLVILFVTLAGLFAGLAYTEFRTEESLYGATSSVCVTYSSYQEQMMGSSVMLNYSELVASKQVCEYAATLLPRSGITAEQIQRMLSIEISSNSYVMKIRAVAPQPQLAIDVANAVAEAFVTQVSSISGNSSLQVLDIASTPNLVTDDSANQIRLIVPAAAFLLACCVIGIRALASNKVRSIPQCVDDEDEILAIIPYTG